MYIWGRSNRFDCSSMTALSILSCRKMKPEEKYFNESLGSVRGMGTYKLSSTAEVSSTLYLSILYFKEQIDLIIAEREKKLMN